jgi:predicted Zn-dependent protease|tara:strand:- start:484 stop:1176 length:693 start_codon:yes stop_codon:yes gene_type:complete
MIILHEEMPEEALVAANALETAYEISSEIKPIDLEGTFRPIPEFNGYAHSSWELLERTIPIRVISGNPKTKAILVLTPRDLYFGESQEDDWILGYSVSNVSVITNARMKRDDGQPSDKLEVSKDLYHKRLSVMAVHEVGHDVVLGQHFKPAFWVNAQTGHELELGGHCIDNSCTMYEVVDIKAPQPQEGHLRLGEEKRFDAGLDDVIERLKPGYLCNDCRSSVRINESYR